MAIAEKSRVKGGNSLKDQWISALLLYSPRPARQRKGQDRAQNSAELLHALTGGSALAPMAVRSFGSGAQEARLAGADLDSQLLYGIGSAALSVETERISNIAKPLQKMFGQGAAGRIALSAIGEGGEEVVENLFQPFLKRATYDQSARFDAGEAGHDFLVGAILGGLGGGVETIGNLGSGPAYNQAGTAIAAVQAPAAPETARGGEAVQSRPLDVMEQEVQRLYGRRDSAAPQAGGGALTQALFGNGKDGPGAAEPDALPITAERDMLEIKKEGIAHGAEDRGRAESAGRFVERSLQALRGVRESGDVRFGFRRPVESGISGTVRSFREELTALGIPCEVTDGEVEWNRDGVTRTRWIEEAAAFAGKVVFINGKTTIAPRNAAGHEAYHFWKDREARQTFSDILQDNLLFSSKVLLDYQNRIAKKYFGGEVDLSNEKQLDKLMEELSAYIAGDIHEGTNEARLRGMLHDYDAVKAAWEALIRSAPEANPTGDADPLMQEIRHLYGRRETAAPEVKTDALTQILLDSIKPAERNCPLDAMEQEVQRLYRRREPAEPEIKTDALTRILLDSIKPAERSRPLDVMEQEVQRLYGRRGAAAPEVKTDALTQILLDSIKPAEKIRPLDVLEQEALRLYERRGAAAPEIKTDALTQILLDSIKPAERSRPLDVLEQEVQRLYGRRDSAALQAGGDALIQALFGDGKGGPGTAETLPVEAGRDMMESERMVTGRGAREETKEAFLRRAAGDGYEVYEGKGAVYGYRRPVQRGDQSGSREEASCAVQAQEELRQLGIDAEIIDGDILYNRNGITQVKAVPQAVTVEKSRIFISNHADIAPRNIAGHEAFHLWKYLAERDAYIEVLADNLLFSSKVFREVQSTIAAAYLGEEADLSDAVQVEKLCEELFAYISGDIHEGTHDASLREMFRDYDAVKVAWEALIKSAPEANPTRDDDPLMQEIRWLYGRRGVAAPEVKTDALTQILLDSIKPAERSRPLDVMEQEVQRLYGRRDTTEPEVKTDALIQVLSGGGTAAPETAAEPDAFLLGFQDDGGGPGTPEQLRVLNGSGSIPLWKSAGNAGPAKPGVPVQISTVDFSDRSAVRAALDRAQEEAAELNYEVSCSVTTDGKVWLVSGEGSIVDPSAIPSSLAGSYSYHNHPAAKTWFSFSAADVRSFFQSGEVYSKASDHVYEYIMARTPETLAVDPDIVYHKFDEIYWSDAMRLAAEKKINADTDAYHEVMLRLSKEYRFYYERRKTVGNQ